jgi:hypothetical protein
MPQAWQASVSINESLLRDVFGIVEVAHFAVCKAVDSILILIHQYTKGIPVSVDAPLHQKIILKYHRNPLSVLSNSIDAERQGFSCMMLVFSEGLPVIPIP